MQGVIIEARNTFDPGRDRIIHTIDAPLTISGWIDTATFDPNSQPTVCLYNGDALMRADWDSTEIRDGDLVCFMRLPAGDDSNGVLRIVAQIALVAAVAVVAGWGGWWYLAAAALSVGGQFLINAVLPLPKPPSALDTGEASPTYNLSAQQNQARLEQPIPIHYGRHLCWPDLAAQPYYQYAGQEQFLYQLFCIGAGSYEIHTIGIDNTKVAQQVAGVLQLTASFEEVEFEIVEPGIKVTLFPANVVTSGLVVGQELKGPNESGDWIGPFTVTPPGVKANKIGYDYAFPQGLFYANDGGGFDTRAATLRFEYREIDDNGNPVAGATFQLIADPTIMRATATPIRNSASINVTPARYQVRAKRLTDADTATRGADTAIWLGLRGYVPDDNIYPGVTLLAVRIRASNQLAGFAQRRFNVEATRKLPTWNPTTGWGPLIATRSIVWAALDAMRANYGGEIPDDRIALHECWQLNTALGARGDYFDARFEQRITLWEALTIIGRCGRAAPVIEGGVTRLVRDGPAVINTAMFNMRNILRGSFEVQYILPTRDSADDVRVEYINATNWRPASILAKLPDSNNRRPATVNLFGCTDRAQAHREGMYIAADNRYRRRFIKFRTELEGHIPRIGDQCTIAHDMPAWGQSGELTAVSGNILTTSEPLDWAVGAGTRYIALRKTDGSVAGVYPCTQGTGADKAVVTGGLGGFAPFVGATKERTFYQFGPGETWAFRARLLGRRPRGDEQVELYFVGEADTVHTADQGIITEPPPVSQLPNPLNGPIVTDLRVVQIGTPIAPRLTVSWQAAEGANYYLVEYSTDGAHYVSIAGHPATTSVTFPVEAVATWVRVAAVGLVKGPWVYWQGTAGSNIPPPGNILALRLARPFVGPAVHVVWNGAARAVSYTVQVWQGGVLRRTIDLRATEFSYSAQDAKADGGPWRTFDIKVTGRGAGTSESPAYSSLTVSNPQVAALDNVAIREYLKSAVVTYEAPADADFAGVIIYISQVNGYTPGPTNEVYRGPDRSIVLDLAAEGTWYMRIAGFDAWGFDGLTIAGQAVITINTPAKLLLELAGKITKTELFASLNERLDNHDKGLTEQTVKVDLDGHVAGIGVGIEQGASGPPQSDIIMLADRFSIAFPAHPWVASTAYALGNYAKPTAGAASTTFVYRCIDAGNSAATEPAWPEGIGGVRVRDGFTDLDGTLLTAHTPEISFSAGVWQAESGHVPDIIARRARLAAADDGAWINAGAVSSVRVACTWNAGGEDNRITLGARSNHSGGVAAANHGYRLVIRTGLTTDSVQLQRVSAGTVTTLNDENLTLSLSADHALALEAEASGSDMLLRGYVNGVLRVSDTDTNPPASLGFFAGFYKPTHANNLARVENFLVTRLAGTGAAGATVADGGVIWESVNITDTIPFVVGLVNGVHSLVLKQAYISDASITNAKIGAAAIDSANIINAAITRAKIGDAAIGSAQIEDAVIGNAKIANAAIDNAKIGNAAVDTLKIAGNAVTIPVSAYTAAVLNLTTDTWETIQDVTIDGEGSPIAVFADFWFANGTGGKHDAGSSLEMRILRAGVTVYTHTSSGLRGHASFNFRHTPATGSAIYALQVNLGGTSPNVQKRFLFALSCKR